MSNGQVHAQLVKFGKTPAKKAAAPAPAANPAEGHGAHAH